MTAQHNSADSPLEQVHQTLRPLSRLRNAVELEQLFLSGVSLAMVAVQVVGLVVTYIYLARTSEKAPPRPPPPVVVEILR